MKANEEIPFSQRSSDSFLRRRNVPASCFIGSLLLFFLPFTELKCGKYALAGNTGIGLATGKDWKPTVTTEANQILKDFSPNEPGRQLPVKATPSIFLLVAIGAGITGIIFSALNYRIRPAVIFCAGLLAVLMLIAMMIQLKMMLRSELKGNDAIEGWDNNVAVLIKIKFTIWYFASMALFAFASFVGYKQHIFLLQDALDQSIRFEFQDVNR